MIQSRCQAELLKLLKEIDTICRENDIEYVLAGGTFIGAIRHEGFLPWDDDADIHMTRENAEKFLELSKTKFPPNRTVVCKRTYPNYPNPIWRYTALDSTAMQRSSFIEDAPKGLYIDIIILQPVGNSEEEQTEALECWEAYSEITTETYTLDSRRSSAVIDLYLEAAKNPVKKKEITDDLYSRLTRYKESETDTYLILSQFMSKCYTKEDLGGVKYVKFEDTMLPVFGNTLNVLYKAYGESWFELPENQEREQHVTVYDFDRPYTEYEKSYMPWVDTAAIHEMLKEKKDRWFSVLKEYQYVVPRTHKLSASGPVWQLIEYIKEKEIDVEKWVCDQKYGDLALLFEPYFNVLDRPPVNYWGLYIDMPDELLWAALIPKVLFGKYRMASKIIKKRQDNREEPLSENLQELLDLCNTIAEMLRYTYSEPDVDVARKLLDEGLAMMPYQVHLCREKAKYMLKDGDEPDDIISYIDGILKYHPEDGELMKYHGDAERLRGNTAASDNDYEVARANLVNGILLLEMEKAAAENGGS